MIKMWKILFLTLLFTAAPAFSQEKSILVKNITTHVAYLESLGSRFVAHNNNKKAGDYILGELQKYGYHPILDSFTPNSREYFNVLSNSADKSKPIILLVAHFDSIAIETGTILSTAPGADDNASGVAILLELARVMSQKASRNKVEFVFFNAEEIGALGSKHLAQAYKKNKVKLSYLINIDMVGTWSGLISKTNPINYVTNKESQFIIDNMKRKTSYPLDKAKKNWRDDQGSFWDNGYAAIEITENGSTGFMHTKNDTSDKLNYNNILAIANAVYQFVMAK